jgi:hypothetical protein
VTVTVEGKELARLKPFSFGRNRSLPLGSCFGPEDPKRQPRAEMSLIVESVVDSRMNVEKTLCGSRRFEPLHEARASDEQGVR